ncbi:aminotransferase class III-fold pyridoxal phosphate-dependent enzyme [Halomonas sp. M4R5S39]|uniref:aminotransferase class III-fold pyridoxal phosphate-dependent enzyme n=1 Tax=Halomonas kalidii TaxID=3043293 RepID=UPI0024A9559D|nr:aminotransferase class III-fold pyridoxal phosphate-dependent enzyme [Halomonas kalidii]MDI5984227.1 aminotransferase class III-fold pyridoxal phosphate-dependent enzyme [Halomonas kalidii]
MENDYLEGLDRAHLVHPVVSWSEHERRGAMILESGNGAYLRDSEGREYLDGFAGLWCVNIGYGHDSVVEAAARQMRQLPYATGYFHYASEPAIRFAEAIARRTPGDLDHVYFTLGGSDAVDSAVRFIRYYHNVTGAPQRKHFIALERGYHGSTSIGSGLTALPVFHDDFDGPSPFQHHIPSPYPYRHPAGPSEEAIIAESVKTLRATIERLGAENVAAFFCEPIQGSGGIIVPPRGWLKAMHQVCREYGVLLVVDEVITGFGRTGPLFALEDEGVVPDLMTMAKGLTSGYAPLGAVVLSEGIYRGIADNAPAGKPVGHGFTYSGHPVSCAVGLEVLRLYEEGGLLANGQRVGKYFQQRLRELEDHPLVGESRGRGLLGALELVTDKARKTKPHPSLRLADRLLTLARERGLIFRAFADDILGFAPPLCCSPEDIDRLIERLSSTLDAALDEPDIHAALRRPPL